MRTLLIINDEVFERGKISKRLIFKISKKRKVKTTKFKNLQVLSISSTSLTPKLLFCRGGTTTASNVKWAFVSSYKVQ